jgi:hypothetical protein
MEPDLSGRGSWNLARPFRAGDSDERQFFSVECCCAYSVQIASEITLIGRNCNVSEMLEPPLPLRKAPNFFATAMADMMSLACRLRSGYLW